MRLEPLCKLKQINQDDIHSMRITGKWFRRSGPRIHELHVSTVESRLKHLIPLGTSALISSFECEKYHFWYHLNAIYHVILLHSTTYYLNKLYTMKNIILVDSDLDISRPNAWVPTWLDTPKHWKESDFRVIVWYWSIFKHFHNRIRNLVGLVDFKNG